MPSSYDPFVGGIRVRYDASGTPELNADDLRDCGGRDLQRIAETDRSKSTTMFTVGNDDGWVSANEVEGASGLHFSILGGYLKLIEVAADRQTNALPMSDVQRFMIQGGRGTIKHRVPPPAPPPLPRNLILDPTRYDPTTNPRGTSPNLLADIEAAIDDAISTTNDRFTVSRGFAMHGYGGDTLVRYLKGDWRGLIASHTFSKTLQTALEGGEEFTAALTKTAQTISTQIVSEITSTSFDDYLTHNSRATQIGIRDKNATAMASFPGSFVDSTGMMPSTPFAYSRTGWYSLANDRTLPEDHPLIVLEIDQKVPPTNQREEFYIPSHVPPTKVSRFFLGFSSWYDAKSYLKPPERTESWYEADILGRDDDGRPTDFRITPIIQHVRGYNESWTREPTSWTASEAGSPKARAFEAAHPLLAKTIAAMKV